MQSPRVRGYDVRIVGRVSALRGLAVHACCLQVDRSRPRNPLRRRGFNVGRQLPAGLGDSRQNRRCHRHLPDSAFTIQVRLPVRIRRRSHHACVASPRRGHGGDIFRDSDHRRFIRRRARGRRRRFHLRARPGAAIRNVRPGLARTRNVRFETGAEDRNLPTAFSRTSRLPGRFRDVGDRSAPARRCLRPHQPDRNP